MSSNREWMYGVRTNKYGTINVQFQQCVDYFLDFAYKNSKNIEGETIDGVRKLLIRCPCKTCNNRFFKTRGIVDCHLTAQGFMKDYLVWYAHGECDEPMDVGQCSNPGPSQRVSQDIDEDLGEYTEYDQMIMECMQQDPNQKAQAFYQMLEQANEPLWEGAKDASTLSITTRLLNWKSDCNVSDSTFDKLLPIIKEILPADNKLPVNFYETKKMLKLLELPSQQIHVCQNHCMLFNGQHSDLDHCIVCNENRYKERGKKVPKLVMYYLPIGPRLQRLFYSKKTAQHLTWHANRRLSEKMSHPCEGRAWHHFNSVFPDFAKETRNVRLGLCTDGFSPNNTSGTPYSCWPVFITVYNLPPWLALKEKYVQMPMLIPGPNNPTQNIDVFLQPLIDELKILFTHGIETYDAHRCNNFQMKAVLLWTVSDFPAYAMLSGWSTHGKLACPYCSNKSGSFQLQFGGKPCWFDCHRQHLPPNHVFLKDKINFQKNNMVSCVRDIPEPTGEEIWQDIKDFPVVYDVKPRGTGNHSKPPGFGITHNWVKKSIFWELPYWGKLLIRHNLDVMHIEKNVFDNLFNTIMGTNYSKDNMKARQDMEQICHRPLLNPKCDKNGNMSKDRGVYTLKKDDVKKVCAWLKNVKFPDGYASNIGSCVNMKVNTFHSFKSHDCHVFMQRLLPLAIRGFVSKETYEAVTELCMFFRVLCSRTLHVDDLVSMKRDIVQTVCKLEKIFPPGFFDSMEHLVIHLANEALLGGPVQYRWMYQYERKLGFAACRGASSGHGLRGGKIKPVARRRNDSGSGIDLDLSRNSGDVASRKRIFKLSNPKHPNKKLIVDKSNVWSHGPYVMIRSPEGTRAFRRVETDGSYAGDEMGVRLSEITAPHDVSQDSVDDDDDVFSENYGDRHGSDDVDVGGHSNGGDHDSDDGVVGHSDDGVVAHNDGGSSEKELIQCNKDGFTDKKVGKCVKDIFEQCYDGDWVTGKKVPQDVRMRLFDRFRTKYRWGPLADQAIYDAFIDELKGRFRDYMINLREKSKQKAKDAKCKLPVKGYDFAIQLEYPPDGIPLEKWQRMCAFWNTDKWKRRSEAGRSNRKNDLCRHTGGSIRFHQHRVNMEKQEGKPVGYMKVFLQTHLTKECKKMLKDGEIIEDDLDKLTFVNDRAKCSYVAYKQQMKKLYLDKDCDDLDVWTSLHPECKGRQIFGIGSSDPDFVVTGKPSFIISGSAQQSQELQKVQAELEREREARHNIEARFEQFQQEREQERADQATWRKSMEKMMKQIGKK